MRKLMTGVLAGVGLVAGAACDTPSLLKCSVDSDCPVTSRCFQGLCTLIDGGGGATCTNGDTRACDAGCQSSQTCANGAWGACSAPCGSGLSCEAGACKCTPTSCAGCCEGDVCKSGLSDGQCGAAGSACAGCPAGQHCDAGACEGCNPLTCASGCCSGKTCNAPSVMHCGGDGGVCAACDPIRANVCDAGRCGCGAGAACAAGQSCDAGACTCDPTSCPAGCCQDGQCIPSGFPQCSVGGLMCPLVTCDLLLQDTCTPGGACACGGGAACITGQRCLNGQCVCDSSVCDAGCCSGNVCSSRSVMACAPAGLACAACDPFVADRCNAAGQCACGTGGVCGAGQQCVNGNCVCNATSCDAGCCGTGQSCTTRSIAACGASGASCAPCDMTLADHCSGTGQCSCGDGGSCASGQRCVGGVCNCDATSCPTGCCFALDGVHSLCYINDIEDCGYGGGICRVCSSAGTSCSAGVCYCGHEIAPLLTPGAACSRGTCMPQPPFNTPSCVGGGFTCDDRSDGIYVGTNDAGCGCGGPQPVPCPSGKQCRHCMSGSTCATGCFDAGAPCTPCW